MCWERFTPPNERTVVDKTLYNHPRRFGFSGPFRSLLETLVKQNRSIPKLSSKFSPRSRAATAASADEEENVDAAVPPSAPALPTRRPELVLP